MAEQEELKIVISAETVELVQSLAKAENALSDFGKDGKFSIDSLNDALVALRRAAFKSTDINEVKRLGQAYNELNQKASSIRDSFYNVADSSRRSRIALYGLNQVVRDLPFGFIAISNNIPVLTDQFEQLVRETGSVRNAFKAFGSAFVAGGGIAIGISVLTSVITTLVQKYGSLSNIIKAATGVQSKYTEQIKKSNESLEKYYENVVDINDISLKQTLTVDAEIIKLDELTKILNDNTSSYNEKYSALVSLKELDADRFANLKIENGLVLGLTEAIDAYTESLILSAKAKGFETQLGAANAELSQNIFLLEDLRLEQERIRRLPAQIQGAAGIDRTRVLLENATDAYNKQRVVVSGLENNVQNLEIGLRDLTRQIESNLVPVREAIRLREEEAKKIKEQAKQQKEQEKETRKGVKANADYAKELKKINEEFELFRFLADRPVVILPIDAVNQFIERLREARKEKEELQKIPRAGEQILFDISVPEINTGAIKSAQEQVNRFIKSNDAASKKIIDTYNDQVSLITGLFNQTLGPAVDGIFSALASGENVLENLGNAFKRLAIDIAATVVKTLLLKAILTAINPAAGIFSSVGGGAGGLAQAIFSAFGGMRTAAPTGPINMQGPGGMSLQGQVVFVQRGADLVGVLNQTSARIGRIG